MAAAVGRFVACAYAAQPYCIDQIVNLDQAVTCDNVGQGAYQDDFIESIKRG